VHDTNVYDTQVDYDTYADVFDAHVDVPNDNVVVDTNVDENFFAPDASVRENDANVVEHYVDTHVDENVFAPDASVHENDANVVEHYDGVGEHYDMHTAQDANTDVDQYIFTCTRNDDDDWSVHLSVNEHETIKVKLDTGADINAMSKSTYDQLRAKPTLHKSNVKINSFIGRAKSCGYIYLPVCHNQKRYDLKFEVVDTNAPTILSKYDCVNMGFVKRVMSLKHENIEKCKFESAKEIINEYADVFKGIGKMPGKVSLKVDPNIKPVAHSPRPVPAALREPLEKKLRELEELDIIERVPVGIPTPWVSSLHVVLKKNNDIRVTIDPRDLNKALLREHHPINNVDDIITRMDGSRYFTALDANMGYYQIELDDDSKMLTCFNTPFGRYVYKRLPMGISSAPEIYMRKMNEIFSDIPHVNVIMDDVLTDAPSVEEHNVMLKKTLQRARDNNVKFSLRKLKLCSDEVSYSGHIFTKNGVKIDGEKVRAVLQMPEPTCIGEIQTLLGMVTYTCKFLQNLSSYTEPLRELIKASHEPGFKFHFDQPQREAFTKLKKLMTTAPVLQYYSLQRPVTVSCDASQSGLGCVLLQDNRPVAYGSKALTEAEHAYAQIEKELLAIVFAFQKFHKYLYGRQDITVETDHLPLLRILEKPLSAIPLRLQRMRLKLQHYSFQIVHKKGTEIPVADALSRASVRDVKVNLQEDILHVDVEDHKSLMTFSPKTLERVKLETARDETLQALMPYIMEGWPENRSNVEPEVRPFYDSRDELAVVDGIVFKGERVVIPRTMHRYCLTSLHASHLGMVKCKQMARDLIYWPGLNGQIEDVISKCASCQENRRKQTKEPMVPSEVPDGPWQYVSQDLFDLFGKKHLITVDMYSEYFDVTALPDTTAYTVIEHTKKIFSDHGIPLRVISDNGPPFNSQQYNQFASDYGFYHVTSSPYHPQGNAMAERAVGIAKSIFTKCYESGDDPYLALLNHRNTPRDNAVGSPAQRLYSRRTRTKLPTAPSQLRPQVQEPENVKKHLQEDRQRAKGYYDRGSKPLKSLGQEDVRMKAGKKWTPARVISRTEEPRSYEVMTPSGKILRRNRRDLRCTREMNIFHRIPDEAMDIIEDAAPPIPVQSPMREPPRPIVPPSPVRTPLRIMPNTPLRDPHPTPINFPVHDTTNPLTSPSPIRTSVTTRSGRVVKRPSHLSEFVTK